jgi:hypothetical protein
MSFSAMARIVSRAIPIAGARPALAGITTSPPSARAKAFGHLAAAGIADTYE